MFRVITILILSCFISIPASLAEEAKTRSPQISKSRMVKRAPVKTQKQLSSKEQSSLIRSEMQKLGFQVRSVRPKGDGSWDVQVNGFDPSRSAGAYKGAVSVATQKMGGMRLPGAAMNGDGEDAPTGNPEGPDSGGDGGGEDAPTGNPEGPDSGGDGNDEDAPGGPPDDEGDLSSRWNMRQLTSTRAISRSATLNTSVTQEGLIVINQESFGHAGFEVSVGGGLCDMFSCRAPMLDTRSLPAANTAVGH